MKNLLVSAAFAFSAMTLPVGVHAGQQPSQNEVDAAEDVHDAVFEQVLNTILSLNAQVTPQTVDTGNAAFGLLFPDVLRIYRLIGDQEPLGDSPAPWGAWEANALDAAMAGDSIPAELVQEQGKWWIRSSTALSNFDANCGVCHQNYGGPDPNQFVGALVMRIPVEQ